MSRVVIDKQEQIDFFHAIKVQSGLNSNDLGKLLGICGRSYRDWISGNTLPTAEGLVKLSELFNVATPTIIENREEFWSCKKYAEIGGKARVALYGLPGTVNGRKKGGKVSQQRRRNNPEIYRALGCQIPCSFNNPGKSIQLAEFIGTVLGDGCLTSQQCQITLHLYDDALYSEYLTQSIAKLFGYKSSLYFRCKYTCRVIVISGVELTRLMQECGLKIGNKVKNQVGIPDWIKSNDEFLSACIRGLYDTDGGTFVNRHTVNGKYYENFGISFTNASIPLRVAFCEYLDKKSITYGTHQSNIMIYSKSAIRRFFQVVQPRNMKHLNRFKHFLGD